MADILIKNMAFPTDRYVILRIDEKGQVYVYGRYPTELHEAIEIPDHGRLIDADMMERECCYGCKNELHKYGNCIDCALANAPTVIPAEESEEKKND